MQSETVVITDIRVEERSGTDILVVEDGNQEQYTTPNPYLVNRYRDLSEDQEDRYIGEKWKIAFELTDGFKDFEGFLYKYIGRDDPESLEERVDQLEDVMASTESEIKELKNAIQGLTYGEAS